MSAVLKDPLVLGSGRFPALGFLIYSAAHVLLFDLFDTSHIFYTVPQIQQ